MKKYISNSVRSSEKEYNRYFKVVSYGVWFQSDQYTSYAFDEKPSETAVSNLKNTFESANFYNISKHADFDFSIIEVTLGAPNTKQQVVVIIGTNDTAVTTNDIKAYFRGQYSDGWGEVLEQTSLDSFQEEEEEDDDGYIEEYRADMYFRLLPGIDSMSVKEVRYNMF